MYKSKSYLWNVHTARILIKNKKLFFISPQDGHTLCIYYNIYNIPKYSIIYNRYKMQLLCFKILLVWSEKCQVIYTK